MAPRPTALTNTSAVRPVPRHLSVLSRATQPRISVVIVNFCQWSNTARLIHQLRESDLFRNQNAEIIVIDNHSPLDPEVEQLQHTEGVLLHRLPRNRGFACAVNHGCRLARGEWMLLLNPDMTVDSGFLDRVDEQASGLITNEPSIGIIGFRLIHGDGSPQASCGLWPTLTRTLARMCLPRSRRKCQHIAGEVAMPVAWVTGCCLMIHRLCLQDLGGLDEDYFLYYEDADLCLRAKECGWQVWFDPAVVVTHHSPLHTRDVPPALRLMTRHALLTYAHKHWPRWQAWLLGGLIWIEAGIRHLRARWRGQQRDAQVHHDLQGLVGDVLTARVDAVQRRIRKVARHLHSAVNGTA